MAESKIFVRYLALLTLTFISTNALAVPASPNPFRLTQPNGKSFNATLVGDEWGYRIETVAGYTVIQDSEGYWTYAKEVEGLIAPSPYRVLSSDPYFLGLTPHVGGSVRNDGSSQIIGGIKVREQQHSVNAVMNGSKKAIVVLINFTSMFNPNSTNISKYLPSYYTNLIFNMSNNMSMNRYFNETSRGVMTVEGVIAGGKWHTSDYSEDYWGQFSSASGRDSANDCIFNLAREALIKADSDINYSQYDADGDGKIESGELAVIVVHAGCPEEQGTCDGWSTRAIWSHAWNIFGSAYTNTSNTTFRCIPKTFVSENGRLQDLILDGVRLSTNSTDEEINCGLNCVGEYVMLAESSPMGTFAHEFGHFLGLPDLYAISSIGEWGLMGHGSWLGGGVGVKNGTSPAHLSAWSKYFLGWINPIKINSTMRNVEVTQIETNGSFYMIFNNGNDTPGNLDWSYNSSGVGGGGTGEYFLIENRQRVGFDAYLPGTGLLVWHIDETETGDLVVLEQADGLADLNNGRNRGDAGDPFFSPNKTSFTCNSNPNSSFYNNSCEFGVTNISASANTMLMDLEVKGFCDCSNCGECKIKLDSPYCPAVNLTEDIANQSGTCVDNPTNFTNKRFDCRGHTIDGDDSGVDYGIYLSGKSDNTIRNCVITDFYDGIFLNFSSNNNLSNDTVNSNFYGIHLYSSSRNTLTNNTVNSNSYGIYLDSSSENTLNNNTANSNLYDGIYVFHSSSNNTLDKNTANSNTYYGIRLYSSSGNTLRDSNMTNNNKNFMLDGHLDSDFNNNIDTSNTADGKLILYIKNESNTVYNNSINASTFYCIWCDNVTVRDLTFTKTGHGVFFRKTNNSRVENINASSDDYGIRLEYSNNNILNDNTANTNNYDGIRLYSSENNTLNNNTANTNTNAGIYLFYFSDHNTLNDNTANTKNYYGIRLDTSSSNTLNNNTANSNNYYGIIIFSSSNNTLTNNTADSNTWYGISLNSNSKNNTLSNTHSCSNNQSGLGYDIHDEDANTFTDTVCDTANRDGICVNSCTGVSITSTTTTTTTTTSTSTTTLPQPTISNITVSAISNTSAIISWTTDQSSDSLVEYGTNTSYGFTAFNSTPALNHTVYLTPLNPKTIYHFRANSTNTETNKSTASSDYNFTTASTVFRKINATANQTTNITVSDANLSIAIVTSANITDGNITVTSHYHNPTTAKPKGTALGRYVDIDSSAELSGSLSSVYLTIAYTDEEVSSLNITESTLSFYYYNTTLNDWQKVDTDLSGVYGSGADTTNNIVWANVSHTSLYTISGVSLTSSETMYLVTGWNLISLSLVM